ncbi:response regulator [Corynebacterium accolens]|uniref:response regulator n=1 Tax=Corynebacterium accolens TaxID=38284 RepID=UPI00266FD684|nr:response regulator transcription factor [Corynebacterium accolens]WKS64858.1 response regulator transcription factor [Corynebacterium accolens]
MSNPEQESEPIRIALVDDQPLLRAGFAMLIGSQEDMSVAWQASDGDEVLDLARQKPVDIILMDVQMARVNGIAATEEVLPEFPETKVIMLTTFDDHNFVHGAISAGASGFLLKDVEPEELLSAIRTVHSGEAVLSPRITAQVLQQVRSEDNSGENPSSHTAAVAQSSTDAAITPPSAKLTPREMDILRLLALGYSNTEISQEEFVSMATVKTHVRHVLTKTGSRDRVQAVLYAYTHGVVTVEELLSHPQG